MYKLIDNYDTWSSLQDRGDSYGEFFSNFTDREQLGL